MGYLTKEGKQYKVTGKNVYAFDNYTKPDPENPRDRGHSNAPFKAALDNKVITVLEHVCRVEKGFTSKQDVYAAFEIVKVSVENMEGEYYAWVVYAGEEKVEPLKSSGTKGASDTDSSEATEPAAISDETDSALAPKKKKLGGAKKSKISDDESDEV